MNSQRVRHLHPRHLLSRRRLLSTTAHGSLGAGALVAGVTPFSSARAITPAAQQISCDDDLIVLAKYFKEAEINVVDCNKCECKEDRLLAVQYELRARLESQGDCDEIEKVIKEAQETTFSAVITRTYRFFGPCKTLVGHHEGRFSIDRDGANLITGELRGTDGLSSELDVIGQSCCAPTRDEGSLTATDLGAELSRARCRFTAAYRSEVEPAEKLADVGCDLDTLKEIFSRSQLSIAGIVACPCGALR